MLLGYALFCIALLVGVFGGTLGPLTPDRFREHVLWALEQPEITTELTPAYLSILQAVKERNAACDTFLEFFCDPASFMSLQYDIRSITSWPTSMPVSFAGFAQDSVGDAERIIREVVIPRSPFPEELLSAFDFDAFRGESFPDLQTFV